MRHFGDASPMEQTQKGALILCMTKQSGVPHLKAKLEGMAAGDILARHDELQELASGRWPAVARARSPA